MKNKNQKTIKNLLKEANNWAKQDPDPKTRKQLKTLIKNIKNGQNPDELYDMFQTTIAFGTAGIRGQMEPGPNRINHITIAKATAGLAKHLQTLKAKNIAIGYDARHNSTTYAYEAASIMEAYGIHAHIYPRALPTPLLAYAIRKLNCDAGIMITASHNPKNDNGYKVYLNDGRQIAPPTDTQIMNQITKIGNYKTIPHKNTYQTIDTQTIQSYINDTIKILKPGPRQINSVYTPMHGVGGDTYMKTIQKAGFPTPHIVKQQYNPNPDFPTIPYPNPEEPGALNLAKEKAKETNADIIIAQDPDADRCSVTIKHENKWITLTGDQTGALIAWWIIKQNPGKTGTCAKTIVSGTLIEKIAKDNMWECQTTLTGFKWLTRTPNLTYAYEEAIGYCVDPKNVNDKDGISASLLILEAAAWLKTQGKTLQDTLNHLAKKHGLHTTKQISIRTTNTNHTENLLTRLQQNPPEKIGGQKVVETQNLPGTPGIKFILKNAHIIIRPSGTEPKIKCYIQTIQKNAKNLKKAQKKTNKQMKKIEKDIQTILKTTP